MENRGRTRADRVLDRYVRDITPLPVKKHKPDVNLEVSVSEGVEKVGKYIRNPGKYVQSLRLFRRILEEKGEEIQGTEIVKVLEGVVESNSMHFAGKEEEIRVFNLVKEKIQAEIPGNVMDLWTFLFLTINQLFTDDSLIFSSKITDLITHLDQKMPENQQLLVKIPSVIEALMRQIQSPWAKVPISRLIDYCVRHLDLFSEELQEKITVLATNNERNRGRRGEGEIRGPMEAGHRVVDGREEVSTGNGSEVWSTKQSGL